MIDKLGCSGLYSPVNESIGTIQIGHPEIRKFLKRVITDLKNKTYIDTPLDSFPELIQRRYRTVKNEYGLKFKIFINHYDYVEIPWISTFDIIVCEHLSEEEKQEMIQKFRKESNPIFKFNGRVCAVSLNADSDITKFDNDSVLRGAIIVFEPVILTNKKLLDDLFHELNHYYMDFSRFHNDVYEMDQYSNSDFADTCYAEYTYFRNELTTNSDVIVCTGLHIPRYYDNVMNKLTVGTIEERVYNLNMFFTGCCYMFCDMEINAYKENIFGGLVRYYKKYNKLPRKYTDDDLLELNETLSAYLKCREILLYIHNNIAIDDKINTEFVKKHGYNYYRVLKKKEYKDYKKRKKYIDRTEVIAIDDIFDFKLSDLFTIDKCVKHFMRKFKDILSNLDKMIAYLPYFEYYDDYEI